MFHVSILQMSITETHIISLLFHANGQEKNLVFRHLQYTTCLSFAAQIWRQNNNSFTECSRRLFLQFKCFICSTLQRPWMQYEPSILYILIIKDLKDLRVMFLK